MNSAPIIEIQRNDNASPKKEIKDENKASENNQKDEISNSLSLSETENRTKKLVTVQEENINGNYGRIYIKESSSNREGDRFDSNTDKLNDKPIQERGKKKIIVLQNNNNKNNNTNNNRKRVISVDNKYEKKNEEERKKQKKHNLRRKSIDRGGDYKNIQVTHIIYSTKDINFHIIDPLMAYTEEMRKKQMNKIDEKYRNGRNGKVKVTYNSSCDKIRVKPKEKENLKGKTMIISHRQNIRTENNINENKNPNKERKEGKQGKDSTIKIAMRNKNTNTAKGPSEGSSSYKKRNEKNNNVNINIKKVN
jgi:hypothetical protein